MTDMDRTVTGPISHLQILPLDTSFCDVILSLTKHTNATKIRNLQRRLVPQRKIQQNYSLTIKTQGTLFPLASSTVYAKKSNCWIPQLFVQLVLSVLAGNSSGGGGGKKAFCPLSLELISPGMQGQGMEMQSRSRLLAGSSMRVCVFILRRTKGRKMQKRLGPAPGSKRSCHCTY